MQSIQTPECAAESVFVVALVPIIEGFQGSVSLNQTQTDESTGRHSAVCVIEAPIEAIIGSLAPRNLL